MSHRLAPPVSVLNEDANWWVKPQIVELLLVNGPAVWVCQLWIFGTEIEKSMKMKVVAEIVLFRKKYVSLVGSTRKCICKALKVVVGT